VVVRSVTRHMILETNKIEIVFLFVLNLKRVAKSQYFWHNGNK